MTNIEYIKNWIQQTSKMFDAAPFKYKLYDEGVHIIKHPDYLDVHHNRMFLEHLTDLVMDFSDRYEWEDILVFPESDTFFDIEEFDFIYDGKRFLPDETSLVEEEKYLVYS
jgi:hypothetical protein